MEAFIAKLLIASLASLTLIKLNCKSPKKYPKQTNIAISLDINFLSNKSHAFIKNTNA